MLCKPVFTGQHLDITPSLVIEILSPSTAYKDLHEKFELYEQAGVKYYLIVDPQQFSKIEVYELVDPKYPPLAIPPPQFSFTLEQGCELTVDFAGAWD